jgi:hypothetical protein
MLERSEMTPVVSIPRQSGGPIQSGIGDGDHPMRPIARRSICGIGK